MLDDPNYPNFISTYIDIRNSSQTGMTGNKEIDYYLGTLGILFTEFTIINTHLSKINGKMSIYVPVFLADINIFEIITEKIIDLVKMDILYKDRLHGLNEVITPKNKYEECLNKTSK